MAAVPSMWRLTTVRNRPIWPPATVGGHLREVAEALQRELAVDGYQALFQPDDGVDPLAVSEGMLRLIEPCWQGLPQELLQYQLADLAPEGRRGEDVFEALHVLPHLQHSLGALRQVPKPLVNVTESLLVRRELPGNLAEASVQRVEPLMNRGGLGLVVAGSETVSANTPAARRTIETIRPISIGPHLPIA